MGESGKGRLTEVQHLLYHRRPADLPQLVVQPAHRIGRDQVLSRFERGALNGQLSTIWLLSASENFMFSEAGSPLLDSQVPSPPQLCPWNLFLVQDGRLDRIRVRP